MKKQVLKNKENNKKNTGITLIALVVTIIVLLILACISINSISGNNSILKRAHDAKEETIVGQEKEAVQMAYTSASVKKLKNYVTSEELKHELDLSVGENKTEVAGQDILNVLFTETNHSYKIKNGIIEKTEIFDVNDGIYIVDQNEIKVSPKIQVPKKDEIVSDIVIKGHDDVNFTIDGEEKYIEDVGQGLCDLAMLNSDYLDVLRELRYIDDDFESFLKNKKSNIDSIVINGIPMFEIVKKADNEYYITVKWDYVLAKDSTQNLFESKVCISSKISFTNSDYTSYDLGDITVEENNTTSEDVDAPFKEISNIENGTVITDRFLLKYNNKEYRGKEGLKDFLDNIVGLKNKEIAKTYVDVGEIIYALKNTSGNFDEQVEQKIRTYFPLPIQNANILEKYVAKSNSLDGIYIKGQRITPKIQKLSQSSINYIEQYISYLLTDNYTFGYLDLKAFDYLLSKELIDPIVLNTLVNMRLEYPEGCVRAYNYQVTRFETEESDWGKDVAIPYSVVYKVSNSWNFGLAGDTAMDVWVRAEPQSELKIAGDMETEATRVLWKPWTCMPEYLLDNIEPSDKNTWANYRSKGLLGILNEQILPYPDKDEFITIANEYATKDEEINEMFLISESLSKYKSPTHSFKDEADLYTSVYSAIIYEAFENGTYEIRSDGKTYTGKDALKNFLITELGFDDPDKLIEYMES